MVKFMIMFLKPKSAETFEDSYNDFLALIERMPDIQRRQVINTLGSPVGLPRYYRILEIYFNDQAQMEASLRSKAGQEAGAELIKRFSRGAYDALYAEVFEESGGRTPPAPDTPAPEA